MIVGAKRMITLATMATLDLQIGGNDRAGHTVWGSLRAAESRPHQHCPLIIGITSVTRSANSAGDPLDRDEKRLVVNWLGEIGGGPG